MIWTVLFDIFAMIYPIRQLPAVFTSQLMINLIYLGAIHTSIPYTTMIN